MKLIVGLGNPGAQYVMTRHNAGFMAIERLTRRHAITGERARFHAAVYEGIINNQRCMLMMPQTFMNRSGLAVGEAVAFFKLDPGTDVIVLVDDIALPVGRIRLRRGGGSGGHNGLADVERALGTRDFPRLRIGIDLPGRIPQVDYVLGRFSADQMDKLNPAIDLSCDAVEDWISHDIEHAMNRYNAE